MDYLAIFLNLLLFGLGARLFINKRVQGFIQLVLAIINGILIILCSRILGYYWSLYPSCAFCFDIGGQY